MSTTTSTPKTLKPYIFHGVDLDWEEGKDQAIGTCPFCGRDGKFCVHVGKGVWRCLVCNEGTDKGKVIQGGNALTFLRLLWDKSRAEVSAGAKQLAADRGLLGSSTLSAWGVSQSTVTGDWIVPGFTADGRLCNLFKYAGRPKKLLATAEMSLGIFGRNMYDPKKPNVYLCEGIWDAMALWEVLRQSKQGESGLEFTSNEEVSLAAEASVLAVPGAMTFFEHWHSLFAGKVLNLMYDSDHPKENGSRVGYDAMRRIAEILSRSTDGQPSELRYLNWGKDGYDPNQKSGYDVRDFLGEVPASSIGAVKQRVKLLDSLLSRVVPVPPEWVPGGKAKASPSGAVDMDCIPCSDWNTLINSCRKAMKWTEGLDRAFSVILASILGTGSVGSQLWVRCLGPASCGKSTLCEAISVNKRHVKALSTIRGFHSGFKDGSGTTNNSLVLKLKGKTLVTKDADSMVSSPNWPQIMGEARDLFDRTARTDYRTGMGMDHEAINMTWILCGTSALRNSDMNELGARFIDCVIMEGIDEDLERDVNRRVAHRAFRNVTIRSNGKMSTQLDPAMVEMMQLTGGYIDYLHDNAEELLAQVEVNDDVIEKVIDLAVFVAYMRARPSIRQQETTEREFSARLVEQFARLAVCLAVVMSKKTVDDEVLRRTMQCALDTSRGRTLQIAKHLYEAGSDGLELRALATLTAQDDQGERKLLLFLRKLGAVELWSDKEHGNRKAWRLTKRLTKLYAEVTSYV